MGTKESFPHEVRGHTLAGIRIFSKLESWERDEIASKVHLCSYDSKSFIIRAGESDTDVYFLVSGRVRANSLSISGKAVHFEELHKGAMFGEWGALSVFIEAESQTSSADPRSDRGPDAGQAEQTHSPAPVIRANDCQAIRDCVVVRMSSADFIGCINNYPSVCGAVIGRLAQMARNKTHLLYESYVYSVPQRIRSELIRIAEAYSPDANGDIRVTEHITHDAIAHRIGGHREGVTIEIQFLNRAGIITWNRKEKIIHDIEKLRDEELS